MRNKIALVLLIALAVVLIAGCGKPGNEAAQTEQADTTEPEQPATDAPPMMLTADGKIPIVSYLDDVEIQYETEAQKQSIVKALSDILDSDADELMAVRYPDYKGKADQWDLSTMITSYFAPSNPSEFLGSFYFDLKRPEVQAKVLELLQTLDPAAAAAHATQDQVGNTAPAQPDPQASPTED
ncbi:MAG: hypothetical protein P9M14_07790 [Candidatus Alcyoniella australis]|nr:hypothetical protein [Candidatus Alcyoniella australis]